MNASQAGSGREESPGRSRVLISRKGCDRRRHSSGGRCTTKYNAGAMQSVVYSAA